MLKVLKNKILIKQDEMPEQINGIYIPKSNERGNHIPPYSGTIVAIGNGVSDTDFKIGLKVLISDLCGVLVMYEGTRYLLIKDSDILGIVEDLNLNIL